MINARTVTPLPGTHKVIAPDILSEKGRIPQFRLGTKIEAYPPVWREKCRAPRLKARSPRSVDSIPALDRAPRRTAIWSKKINSIGQLDPSVSNASRPTSAKGTVSGRKSLFGLL